MVIKPARSAAAGYAAALISLLAAFGLTFSARPLFETTSYALFLGAVMFSSWYGGLTPGLLVVLLSVFALDRYFVPEPLSGVLGKDDVIRLGIFLLVAGVINHLSRRRILAEESLRRSHDQLEIRIGQRTAELHRLSAQLLQFQDEERRKTARLLHETVAQSLAALKMELSVIKRCGQRDQMKAVEALNEAVSLTDSCIREVRTASYLLHPPLLDEMGLASALEWYCSGFERRSGIATQLELPPDLGRLRIDTETTIFRVVQECLTNIHRHSGSRSAQIRIQLTSSHLVVEVRDCGHGISSPELNVPTTLGVGIMGMRERVHQAGGTLEIESGTKGTTVTAVLPREGVRAWQEPVSS